MPPSTTAPETAAGRPVHVEPPLQLVVVGRHVWGDVVVLDLRRVTDTSLPRWTPGAHVELDLAPGLSRQYSLCGSPQDESWRVAVLREPNSRGGSRYVHDHLEVGTVVQCRGPVNRFPLERASKYIFVAGGIGITPLLPMIEQVASARAEWSLTYGARSRNGLVFGPELVDRHPDRVRLVAEDQEGLLPIERLVREAGPDTLIYCCGPEPMLAAAESAATKLGMRNLRLERFRAGPTRARSQDIEFEVKLARSGGSVFVAPGRSILETLRGAGVTVLSSCSEGTCGTCESFVLEGQPDHRDSVLTADQRESGDSMMICVSRSLTRRIVLDL
jgi:ferredoxin-NADP reductase